MYSIADVIDYQSITSTYRSFITMLSQENEPTSYQEAIKYPRWIKSMKNEIQVLEDNHI